MDNIVLKTDSYKQLKEHIASDVKAEVDALMSKLSEKNLPTAKMDADRRFANVKRPCKSLRSMASGRVSTSD